MKFPLALSVLCLLPAASFGFSGAAVASKNRRVGWVATFATVYGADGEVFLDHDTWSNNNNNNAYYSQSPTDFDRINRQKGQLARVAAAFPPPGHSLNVNKIQDISVLRVDESFLEMQAVVCEQETCVTLSVPVPFSKPCAADVRVDCALENLNDLDGQAQQVLGKLAWELQHHEQVAEGQRRAQEVLGTEDLELPSWWVQPGTVSAATLDECNALRNTLNEETFINEMKAMATFGLRIEMGNDLPIVVTNAAMAAVSPMGVVLRALVQPSDDPHDLMSVDVPIAFQKKAAGVDELRSFVMAAVEFVASY